MSATRNRHALVRLCLGLLAALLALPAAAPAGDAPPRLVERPDWQRFFTEAGVTGTLALWQDGADTLQVFDARRAATPYLPASTFKIANALIALDCGAVTGPDEVFPWDGRPRDLAAWNADLTLRQAFAVSCVPVFQEIARRVGPERMAAKVASAGYGNADIAGGIDRFWLDGALRISALEQLDFLSRLDHRRLPFSPAAMDTVLDLMTVEKTDAHTLLAKTGWAARVSPGVGWYVGMVKRGGQTWYFALNIDLSDPAKAPARQAVVRAVLQHEGLLQPRPSPPSP